MKYTISIMTAAVLAMLIIFSSGCASKSVSSDTSQDYQSGMALGEKTAWQDAYSLPCPKIISSVAWFPRSKIHRDSLISAGKSESFINGFLEGFEQNFEEFQRSYCGE